MKFLEYVDRVIDRGLTLSIWVAVVVIVLASYTIIKSNQQLYAYLSQENHIEKQQQMDMRVRKHVINLNLNFSYFLIASTALNQQIAHNSNKNGVRNKEYKNNIKLLINSDNKIFSDLTWFSDRSTQFYNIYSIFMEWHFVQLGALAKGKPIPINAYRAWFNKLNSSINKNLMNNSGDFIQIERILNT